MEVVDGITTSQSFNNLSLSLRQKGLQIISASSITRVEFAAEVRLQRMKDKLYNLTSADCDTCHPKQDKSIIRYAIDKLLSKFRKKQND